MGSSLADALRALAAGELVVYPTDTLLGVAARATDRDAVDRLAAAKDRPRDMPVSVAVSSTEEVESLATLSTATRRFLRSRLPGPYTLLLPASARARRLLAPSLLSPGGRLGVRVPDHPVARELARRAGAITSTSANRHGTPPARTVAEARRAFGDRVAVYLPAVPRPTGRPSMLVDLTRARPHVLRRR